nr:MAG TPA: hypothetical protein [Caudoviricetes sp.]
MGSIYKVIINCLTHTFIHLWVGRGRKFNPPATRT